MSDWSIPTEPPQPARAAPSDDDVLDDIVAECVESGTSELAGRVESACLEHPRLADALRRRIESLREVGLLRDATLVADERFPERLGDFRLIERLGGGGMGVVFRARQQSLDRDVALKLIRPDQLYFPRARERFQRETEAVARLQHPGIVPIYAVGDEGGVPYFAMELIGGCTLATVLSALQRSAPERLGGVDLQAALQRAAPAWAAKASAPPAAFEGSYVNAVARLVIQVAEALDHAHARDVLHRDVKPSNIAVTPDGRALLFDFGLASFSNVASRLTAPNAEVGSVHYMAPEQLRGDASRVGPHADVYALGVTLYEALALQLPYAERDLLATRKAILEGRRDPLRARNRAVPRDLEIVCAKAMEIDPARRYATAGDFARDLRNVLEHRPIRARSPSAALVAARWIRRHPTASTAFAVAIGLPSVLAVQSSLHATKLSAALDATEKQRKLAEDARADATKQRDVAQEQARETKEVNTFLVDLFADIDPALAEKRELTARDLLDEGAERLEKRLLDQPLMRASLYDSIGQSYAGLGEWERAEATLKRALALCEEYAGAESLPVSASLGSLASLEFQLGRPEAREHAQRAVEMRRRLSSERDFALVDLLLSYALTLEPAHLYEEGEAVYREILEILDELPGDRRAERADVLSNFANLLIDGGRNEDALAIAQQSLELQRELDRGPHPALSTCLNAIGLSSMALGRYDEARPALDELLEIEARVTGERSMRYAAFLVNKARLECDTGHVDEGLPMLERASEVFEHAAPRTHPLAIFCNERLASAQALARDWAGARKTFAALQEPMLGAFGPSAARTVRNRVLLARACEALGDWEGAEHEAASVLESCADAGVPDDDQWEMAAAADLSRWSTRRGDLEAAQSWLARAIELRGEFQRTSEAHLWVTFADAVLAQARGDVERATTGLEMLSRSEPVKFHRDRVFWAPEAAHARLARLIAGEQPERARKMLEHASETLSSLLGDTHPESVAAATALAEFAAR